MRWHQQIMMYIGLLCCLTALLAQEAPPLNQLRLVGKPERSESEFVSASTKDANGRTCSAIKVISDLEGFKYDSYNGIVKVDDQPGQDMVYLSPDERVLQIFHTGYQPLKLILSEIGITLTERRIWTITIAGDKKLTELSIAIISTPEGAEVFIDGQSRGTNESHKVSAGRHEIRLVKSGFKPIIETIMVDENNTLFRYTLKEQTDVNFQIDSDPGGATVYLDNVKLPGMTLLSAFYVPGRYKIKVEKEWYVPLEDYIEIQEGMGRKVYKLEPDFATLLVASAPQAGLDIFFNGKSQNVRTPYIFEKLEPGSYRIRARSNLYETEEIEMSLTRGEKKEIKLSSTASYATLTIKAPSGAIVFLNGQKIERLQEIQLEPSMVTVRAEMKKAKPAEQRLVLKKGDHQIVELTPQYPVGTIQVAVIPLEAKVELVGDDGEKYVSSGAKIFADMPIGNYRLKVSQVGYPDKEETLQLKEGDKLTRSVTLVKREPSSNQPEVVLPVQPKVVDTSWRDPKTGIEFVLVKGGTFDMGDTFGDGDKDEKPVHKVTVSDFYLGKTEVTVAQYRAFCQNTGCSMSDAPSWGWQEDHPMINVRWNDATAFCKWAGYRLPTEAEWEYAAREGGRRVRFGNGKDVADPAEINFDGSAGYKKSYSVVGVSRQQTTVAGSFAPNSLGLYDMAGNVWEWCQDWYGADYYAKSPSINPQGPSPGKYRVLRGGSWNYVPNYCRATNRLRNDPDLRNSSVGFRVVGPLQ